MSPLGFVYDVDRCIGCKACQVACKDRNHLGVGVFYRRVETFEHEGALVHFSGGCHHCAEPACVKGCPTKAMNKREDGMVIHEAGKCIGCSACTWACPYGAISFNDGMIGKCHGCGDLWATGEEPACVQGCVTHCLTFRVFGKLDYSSYPSFLPSPHLTKPSLLIAPQKRFVVVGTGIAGLMAAQTIRTLEPEADIVMIGDEFPYRRPMLTKASLKGFDGSRLVIKNEEWFQEQRIKIFTDQDVKAIDSKEKKVILEQGEITYDRCIYALGARSFMPFTGGNVVAIRTLEHVADLRKRLLVEEVAVIIGGGVVGLEAAWELKKAGLSVIVLEQGSHLMGRFLDEASASVLAQQVKAVGIQLHMGIQVEKVSEAGVHLQDGTFYPTGLVVVSCGISPNVEVAKAAGLTVNRGVVVNEFMETSDPYIYACGDCTDSSFGLWDQSIHQAQVAAFNSCGMTKSVEEVMPSLLFHGMHTSVFATGKITDTFDVEEGLVNEPTTFRVNHLEAKTSYKKYFYEDGKLVGAILIGDLQDMARIKESC